MRRAWIVCGVLLASLGSLASIRGQQPLVFGYPDEIAAEIRMREALNRQVTFDFQETPLEKVAAELSRQAEVEIQIDSRALEDAGAGSDTPVTAAAKNISLHSALEILLRPLDLTWINKEVILITTPEKAGSELVVRAYPVADLLVLGEGADAAPNFDTLIESITSLIQPTTWDEVGGPGSVTVFPGAAALAISQTRDVHKEVESLLITLRNVRDAQGIPVEDYRLARKNWLRKKPSLQPSSPAIKSDSSPENAGMEEASPAISGWQRSRVYD